MELGTRVLLISVVTLGLLLLSRPRYDLVALLLIVALPLCGILTLGEVLVGFSNPAVVAMVAIYVFSNALVKSGGVRTVGVAIQGFAKRGEFAFVFFGVLLTGALSAFVFNSFIVVALIPLFLNSARTLNIAPSRILIPLTFGLLVGGALSLTGTPANLSIQAVLQSPWTIAKYPQLKELGIFEFVLPAAILLLIVALYFALIGRKLLPAQVQEKDLTDQYRVRKFLTEVKVEKSSNLVNRTLAESDLGAQDNVTILGISRLGESLPSGPSSRIEVGDLLLLQGQPEDILRIRAERNLSLQEERGKDEPIFGIGDMRVMEVIVAPGCRHAGRTLREIGFRAQFGLNAVALWRHGEVYPLGLKEMPLRVGDVLLLQGMQRDFDQLRRSGDFLLTDEVSVQQKSSYNSLLVFAILGISLNLALFGILDLPIALISGALVILFTRVLNVKEAYESIEWSAVILTVGMLALGTAWVKAGIDTSLAETIGHISKINPNPYFLFLTLFLLSTLLTQFARKITAAILMTLVALALAKYFGANAHAFLLPVLVGASCPFLNPYADQASSTVMGPGGYRWTDYVRVGLPLLMIVGLTVSGLATWMN